MAKKNLFEVNFASNLQVRDRVTDLFLPAVKQIRSEREILEEKWLEFHGMWNVERDGRSGYNGRSRLYVPEVRKSVESQARQLTKAAFPNADYIECVPEASGTNEGADLHKEVRKHQARKAQLELKFFIFARQECLYGTSPVSIAWKKQMRKVWASAKAGKKIKPKGQDVEIFNGPTFDVVDLFKWYALDATKWDFQDGGCFVDSMLKRSEVEAREKLGLVYGFQKILDSSMNAMSTRELERYVQKVEASGLVLEMGGGSGEAIRNKEEDTPNNKILLTKVNTLMYFPEAIDKDNEDPEMPIPVEIEIYDGKHVASIRRQQEYHQRAPYVCGRYIKPHADQFYGQGIPWAIQYQQHELNSKAEQAMDSVTLALNPIAFIDPALAGSMGSFEVEPGATWWVNPQGVKLSALPDVSAAGYQAMGQIRALMADYSDRSPALPSQLQGQSRTATQSQIVSSAIGIDTEAFAMQNEIEVLIPAMEQWDSLSDQNITEDQIIMLTGSNFRKAKKLLVPKNKLIGQYAYTWVGASVGENRQILTRQLIDFMKIVATLPPEDKQKLNANLAVIAKMIFDQGMGLPRADKVFGVPELESTDPQTELLLLQKGMEIQVQMGDEDQNHMAVHDAQLKSEKLDDDMKEELSLHIAKHGAQLKYKQQMAQQMMMAQQQMQMQMAQQQQGKTGNSVGSGNRTQLSPAASAGDMGSGVSA